MFSFNAINLDVWTETYGVSYYMTYLSNWPDLFSCALPLSLFLRSACFRVADESRTGSSKVPEVRAGYQEVEGKVGG